MNKAIRIATRLTRMICSDEQTYIYDPDHKKHPGGGYHKTERGWSKVDTEDKREQKSNIPLSRRHETDRIMSGLFSDEEKNAEERDNGKYNTESAYYAKAIETQKLMESKLDDGHEEEWLGRGASRCGFSEEEIMEPGPKLIIGKIKSIERAREKVRSDFEGDWGKLKDGVRCSVALDRVEDLPKALDGFRKTGCKLAAPPKNRFEKRLKSGYGDCLLSVDFGNGFVGEVQFHLKHILAAKEFHGGHKLYESERSVYAKYDSKTPVEKYKPEDQDMLNDLIREQKKLYDAGYERSIVASKGGKRMKYMLSDNKYSFYIYGDWDFPAFCCGNNFPQFYNGKKWIEVKSFLKFADNAVEVDEETFKKRLKKYGVDFNEK